MPLAGNSIATDRGFLARDMPELDGHLHYRMVDVSSIKELCRRWYPRIFFAKPEKGLAHRALADIEESIRELTLLPAHHVRRRPRTDLRAGPGRGRAAQPPVVNPLRTEPASERYPATLNWSSSGRGLAGRMVGVAQLVEHLVVVQVVAGSSPVTHPMSEPHRPVAAPPRVSVGTAPGSGAHGRRR